ncbi:MAG: hypothetical protein PVH25_03545 [Burkholderiales bacterium]|jgi:hypothetical protein
MIETNGEPVRAGEVDAQRQWEQVLKMAWRPAWSIRSRKGCLAPLIDWWKARGRRGG